MTLKRAASGQAAYPAVQLQDLECGPGQAIPGYDPRHLGLAPALCLPGSYPWPLFFPVLAELPKTALMGHLRSHSVFGDRVSICEFAHVLMCMLLCAYMQAGLLSHMSKSVIPFMSVA